MEHLVTKKLQLGFCFSDINIGNNELGLKQTYCNPNDAKMRQNLYCLYRHCPMRNGYEIIQTSVMSYVGLYSLVCFSFLMPESDDTIVLFITMATRSD